MPDNRRRLDEPDPVAGFAMGLAIFCAVVLAALAVLQALGFVAP